MKQIGKWTAEGARKGNMPSMLRRKTCVMGRGYVCIPQVHGRAVNQGGTAEKFSVLDREFYDTSVKDVFVLLAPWGGYLDIIDTAMATLIFNFAHLTTK